MELEKVKEEVEKLNKQHRVNRWVELVIAIFLLVFSFYLIDVSYSGSKIDFIQSLAEAKVHIFLGPLAASLFGALVVRWNGSKELNLLNKIVEDNDQSSKKEKI